MGNEHSTSSHGGRCDGIPFVSWQPSSSLLTSSSSSVTASPLFTNRGRLSISSSSSSKTLRDGGGGGEASTPASALSSPLEDANDTNSTHSNESGTGSSFHFAEPSSYRYDKVPRVVSGRAVFTRPVNADSEIINKSELVGSIAIVERGGRVHFPEIVRRVLAAGAIGVVFIEKTDNKTATQALFDGFHSSGRQSVPKPILLLSKFHADQLVADKPSRLTILILSGDQAMKHIVPDDIYFAVATAARAGEVELLKQLLYSDTSGSVLEVSLCFHSTILPPDEMESANVCRFLIAW